MTTRTVMVGAHSYTVVRDLSIVTPATVVGRVLDELTGDPIPGPVTVTATIREVGAVPPGTRPAGYVTVTRDGYFALSGPVELTYPDLASTAYRVTFRIASAGYVSADETVTVPLGTTAFPVAAPDLGLRRRAVWLRGRLLALGSLPPAPPPGVSQVTVIAPAGLTGFAEPFAGAHGPGATIEAATLNPAGPDRGLLGPGAPGSQEVILTSRTGVVAGTVLDISGTYRSERVVVANVDGPADPARPGPVELTTPLRHVHTPADTVVAIRTVATGAGTTIVDGVHPDEQVALVALPAALVDGQPCVVDGATSGAEVLTVHLPTGATDPDGYFVVGPAGRAPVVELEVTPGGSTHRHVLQFDQAENVLELRV